MNCYKKVVHDQCVQNSRGQLTLLSLALAGAFTAMMPSHAMADTTISTSGQSYVFNTGTQNITITSAGGISATTGVINRDGTIGALYNSGTISAINTGVRNSSISGTISALFNNAGALISAQTGIYNYYGTIATLNNSGTISGTYSAIGNTGVISTLINGSGGVISGGNGIMNTGTIGALSNSGTISATSLGIRNGRIISSLFNDAGAVISAQTGIYNYLGTIGTLSNRGTIVGSVYAIRNSSTLGPITNSGTIAGNILNASSNALTINGGSGSTYGTLTGYNGATGTITSTLSNLVFGTGNLILNDDINVGSYTVTNAASTLQINGYQTITGNYAQNSGASLLFGVADSAVTTGTLASDSGYGRLYVTGNTTIASGSTIALVKLVSYPFAVGQRYVLIVTSGTATYNASSLNYLVSNYSGPVSGASVSSGTNTDLVITLGSATISSAGSTLTSSTPSVYATTNNAISAINGLFKYTGVDTSLLDVFNSAAAVSSTSEANKAGAQLSPTAVTSGLVQASAVAAQTVATVAYSHIDGLRNGSGSGSSSGVATGERSYDLGMWGQVFGGHTNQSERENVSGYRANYNGLLLATDAQVSERVRAGGLFSYTKTSMSNTDDNAGSSSSVNSYGLSAYAGYSGDPWYVNAMAGVTKQQYSTVRDISYTGFSGVANGSFNGLQYSSSVQAGYPLNIEKWLPGVTLTPLAGLSYSTVRQNGYTESGGNGAALTVDAASTKSLKSELAMRMESSFDSAYGKLQPLVQLGWHHEYLDSRLNSSASFAADTTGTSSFVTQSASPIRNTGSLVLGMTLVQSKSLKIAARYGLEAGSGYTDQAASLQLRWQY